MEKLKELKLQQIKKIFNIAAITIVVIVAIGSLLENLPICVFGFVLMIGAVVFNIIFYRCPRCGRHLGRDGGDYCQYCGVKFDDVNRDTNKM